MLLIILPQKHPNLEWSTRATAFILSAAEGWGLLPHRALHMLPKHKLEGRRERRRRLVDSLVLTLTYIIFEFKWWKWQHWKSKHVGTEVSIVQKTIKSLLTINSFPSNPIQCLFKWTLMKTLVKEEAFSPVPIRRRASSQFTRWWQKIAQSEKRILMAAFVLVEEHIHKCAKLCVRDHPAHY